MFKSIISLIVAFLLAFLSLTGCKGGSEEPTTTDSSTTQNLENEPSTGENEGFKDDDEPSTQVETPTKPINTGGFDISSVPLYSGTPYAVVNNNKPFFTESDYTTSSFEYYSPLDDLGRCGVTYACVGQDIMPTEERGEIGQVKPTGWHTVKYDCVDGKYLYNRCHLIGFQLTGENANTRNLITGTRYMNVDGMLPFENEIDDYVDATNNHVLYRVTPIFEGNNLLATGVLMEAYSVEDNGKGVCFNVFCYNVQPGVILDYSTGESKLASTDNEETTSPEATVNEYVLNTNSKKFHKPNCSSVNDMSEKNKDEFTGTRDELLNNGYSPCGYCKP